MANIARMTTKRLGELLVEQELLTPDQLAEALSEQKKVGGLLGQILIRKEFVSEADIARAQATQFSVPYLPAGAYEVNPEVAYLFPLDFLQKNQFAPIDLFGRVLVIVVSMPLDSQVISQIETSTGRSLQVYVSTASGVAHFQSKIAEILSKQGARPTLVPPAERAEAHPPKIAAASSGGKESAELGDDWASLLKSVANSEFIQELEKNLDRVKADKESDEND